jgi:endogenous inhibitor of DNA gyrase (YacG/DUF329 family)
VSGDLQLRCPICGKSVSAATHPEFPFCSERCRLIDLANWATERYVISEPAADETMPSPDGEPDSNNDGV